MAEDKVAEELSEVKLTEAGVDDDVVDPWNVTSKSDTGIDYDKLISRFCDSCFSINFFDERG